MQPHNPPREGSEIELIRPGGREAFATTLVVEALGDRLRLEAPGIRPDDGPLTLRFWDDEYDAWDAETSVSSSSDHLVATLLGGWQPAVLRRSARTPTRRVDVDLLTLGGDGAVIRRVRTYCVDVSSNGCRVAGTGSPPHAGDVIQISSAGLSGRLDARIVRCGVAAFGSWEAGIEFLSHDTSESAAILRWRDEVRA
jgi:hypothetical protein